MFYIKFFNKLRSKNETYRAAQPAAQHTMVMRHPIKAAQDGMVTMQLHRRDTNNSLETSYWFLPKGVFAPPSITDTYIQRCTPQDASM